MTSPTDRLFVGMQYLLPQRALSRLVGWLAESETTWLKNAFINWFIKRYDVDMSEAAESEASAYKNFNAFFTRALRDGARELDQDKDAILCPADGCISQLGAIEGDSILQAKGHDYDLKTLLGGDEELASQFVDGSFMTVYLSPRDYHRVHMPRGGKLRSTVYVPGELFSVNDATAAQVPNLFARNERLVCTFETDHGPMAVVLVGAMIVAGIETVWGGQATPFKRSVNRQDFPQRKETKLAAGEEMGRFKLGSTAIVLFGKDCAKWEEELKAGDKVRMGQRIGRCA